MYDRVDASSGESLCRTMAEECDTAILAFSTGKDSIAAWLQLRKYFKHVIPYYCYTVPGLEFVENSLAYYEDFFGTHIYRLPHRSLYRLLRNLVFQSPEHMTMPKLARSSANASACRNAYTLRPALEWQTAQCGVSP